MLDNLVNADLSGIVGKIIYNSGDAITAAYISGLLALGVLAMLIFFFSSLVSPTRTERYRREMVDLYVVGTIKKLATKEGIDLEEELKEFNRRKKKANLENKGLDVIIEREKASQIIDEQEKAYAEFKK